MARRSRNRGFASMDPERRRRIASEGGRASHSGRGRIYEDECDEDYDDNYDEDEDQHVSGRYGDEYYDNEYGGDEDYQGDEGDYEDTGYEDEYDEDDYRRGRGHGMRGERSSSGSGHSYDRRGDTSRRGFDSMDPEQRRRIARMGGQAIARSRGRDFYEEIGHEGGERVRDEYGPEFYSRIGRQGRRAKWDEGENYYGRRSSDWGTSRRMSSSRNGNSGRRSTGRSSSGRGGNSYSGIHSSGRRGFGSMPREEVRRIARKGGLARWGEDGGARRRRSRGR